MDVLNKTDLEKIILEEDKPCISIYMPTHQTGVEVQQDPIRLKNLLREAERLLSNQRLNPREIEKMLEPASKLLQDSYFWQHQSDGLAIFLSSKRGHSFRLPLKFEELVVVKDRFHIKPLLSLFTSDGQFYVLALSKNIVRLLNCTRYSISEVDLTQVVGSMDEEMPTDDHQDNLQLHTSGAIGGKSGSSSVTFHGQGGSSDESAKNDLLRYFHIIDDGLTELLQGDRVPLILAGVDYLLPIYKEANTYPNLIDTVITGNPDLLSAEELHKSAWQILSPLFQTAQEDAIAYYKQLLGQNSRRATENLGKIIPAAVQGRVETLFVTIGEQQWGTFNPVTNEIEIHDRLEPGDEYLLDNAALHTYLKGGKVYILEPEKMPGDNNIAAVLRY
jgi:hypothetical protein